MCSIDVPGNEEAGEEVEVGVEREHDRLAPVRVRDDAGDEGDEGIGDAECEEDDEHEREEGGGRGHEPHQEVGGGREQRGQQEQEGQHGRGLREHVARRSVGAARRLADEDLALLQEDGERLVGCEDERRDRKVEVACALHDPLVVVARVEEECADRESHEDLHEDGALLVVGNS